MEIFLNQQFLFSLISGVFIGGIAGYLGTLMVLKKMTAAVDPISHLVLPGVALAYFFHFDSSLGAFLSIIAGMFLIWYLEMKTKLATETLIAVLFTAGVALAFLISSKEELEQVLVGDISKIDFISTIVAIIFSILIFFFLQKIYKKIILIEISEDLAKIENINPKFYLFFYLFFLAIVVALQVKLVGGLLTAALIAIPAATAKNLSKNLSQYSFLGIFFGAIFVLIGIFLSIIFLLPAGILITFVAVFFFLISFCLQK